MVECGYRKRIATFLCQTVTTAERLVDLSVLLEAGAIFVDPHYSDSNLHLPEGRVEGWSDEDYRSQIVGLCKKHHSIADREITLSLDSPLTVHLSKYAQVRMAIVHASTRRDFEYRWELVAEELPNGDLYVYDLRLYPDRTIAEPGLAGSCRDQEAEREVTKSGWFVESDTCQGQNKVVMIPMHTHCLMTVHASPPDWATERGVFGITTRFGEVRFYYRDANTFAPIVDVVVDTQAAALDYLELESMAGEALSLTQRFTEYFGDETGELAALTYVWTRNYPPSPNLVDLLERKPLLAAPAELLGIVGRPMIPVARSLGVAQRGVWDRSSLEQRLPLVSEALQRTITIDSESEILLEVSSAAATWLSALTALLPTRTLGGWLPLLHDLAVKLRVEHVSDRHLTITGGKLFDSYEVFENAVLSMLAPGVTRIRRVSVPWRADAEWAESLSSPQLNNLSTWAIGWCVGSDGSMGCDASVGEPAEHDSLTLLAGEIGMAPSSSLPQTSAIPCLFWDKGGRMRAIAHSSCLQSDITLFTSVKIACSQEPPLPRSQIEALVATLRASLVEHKMLAPVDLSVEKRWNYGAPGLRYFRSKAITQSYG